jgi:tetratricopeptide (TPR) repeat protein
MAKTLLPTTIIPPHLYVERAADRQLEQIIEAMGRPGYVLVARQMGKTNLLLNMKRQRERSGDIVQYFDLSYRFDTASSLFRYIIDTVIEAAPELFSNVAQRILQQRESVEVEPNIEYDRHLRLLLKAIPDRKLIIILDEVDSLISVPYSDKVFAQIRSMYFSRATHEEYGRLTYVLSGVAEPVDLIKDKNISPSNIGEKIYLDDFSHSELNSLLTRAGLKFDKDVVEEIYAWTAGNPRMTWDVCSELEDVQLSGRAPNPSDVAAVVQKLYLTRYDRAPVDHIRVLAESDKSIREAIISLHYGKGDTLDEKAKSRLYLAGITGGFTGDSPAIKNRVIEAALSDKWLAQISATKQGYLKAAAESFSAGQYGQTIHLITESVREQGSDASLSFAVVSQLGMAQYYTGQFLAASATLRKSLQLAQTDEQIATTQYFLGAALLNIGAADESLEYLKSAAELEGELQLSAKVSLTSAYLAQEARRDAAEILRITGEIINQLSHKVTARTANDDDLEVLGSAYYNSARAYYISGDRKSAQYAIQKALQIVRPALRPALVLYQLNQTRAPNERRDLAEKAGNIVISEKLKLAKPSGTSLHFSEQHLATILLRLLQNGHHEGFERLLSYALELLYSNELKPFALLLRLVQAVEAAEDRAALAALLWVGFDQFPAELSDSQLRLNALHLLAQFSPPARKREALDMYVSAVAEISRPDQEINCVNYDVLVDFIHNLVQGGEHQRALEVIQLARRMSSLEKENDFRLGVMLKFLEMSVYSTMGDVERAILAGEAVLSEIRENASRTDASSSEADGTIASIRATVEAQIKRYLQPQRRLNIAAANQPKIGRNVRVTVRDNATGRTWTTKYKNVSENIIEGRYSLLSIQTI